MAEDEKRAAVAEATEATEDAARRPSASPTEKSEPNSVRLPNSRRLPVRLVVFPQSVDNLVVIIALTTTWLFAFGQCRLAFVGQHQARMRNATIALPASPALPRPRLATRRAVGKDRAANPDNTSLGIKR